MLIITEDLMMSFKHKTDIQIRFKDIDQLGHVNNANHITYFETSRVNYFKDVFKNETNWKETGLILAHTEITYKNPIFLEDTISCYTKVSKMRNKSFDMENLIVKTSNSQDIIVAYGKSVLVCLNYLSKETIPIPTEWIQKIKQYDEI
ncbi:MAG: acyl-CoA thioesterase [Bacteroidia bacterium]|jgi:acyl-CoA thioester hydrolase|nr:acyl-CoA thioesterase [Bacteroidia bacterium]